MSKPPKICTSCGYSTQGVKKPAGNVALELFLWGWGIILFLAASGFVGVMRQVSIQVGGSIWFFPLLILVVALCYTIWRRDAARVVCSSCGRDSLIEWDSPIAHQLRQKITVQEHSAHSETTDNTEISAKTDTKADDSHPENKQQDSNKQPESTMDFVKKNLNRDLPD